MRRLEYAPEHVLGHTIWAEAPDVAALGDDAVHRLELVLREAPAARIGRALGRAGGVEARRRRRSTEAIVSRHGGEA